MKMCASRLRTILAFLSGCAASLQAQHARVSGAVSLDSTWAREVYVSHIPDFNQMLTATTRYIVAEGLVDASGTFDLEVPTGPEAALFRIHFVKKEAPVSMLIIGGNDQNHAFFVAQNNDLIRVEARGGRHIINQEAITGTRANDDLDALFQLVNNDTLPREYLKQRLLSLAQKSSSELNSLLAIHNLFGLNDRQKRDVREVLSGLKADNPYGTSLQQAYSRSGRGLFVSILLLLTLIISLAAYRFIQHRKTLKIRLALSQRETHIAGLILDNKTNKEIADALNIEISTVKTHVNNIFSKLKLAKRSELQKYNKIFKSAK